MKTALYLSLFIVSSLLLTLPALAAKRVALVIGNGEYEDGMALKNPVNDATAVAASLRDLGFEVITGFNLDLGGMEEALRTFRQSLSAGDMGWFFYAGHGLQADNRNYLLPIRSGLREGYEIKRKTLDLDTVTGAMEEAGSTLNIIVLDCCRNNPLTRGMKGRSIASRGLAQQTDDQPEGIIVAYSTAANTEAADGEGTNSPYTQNLVKALRSRPHGGLELKEVFFSVARQVKDETGQKPALYIDATLPSFYLDKGAQSGPEIRLVNAQPPAPVDALASNQISVSPPTVAVAALPNVTTMPPGPQSGVAPASTVNSLETVFANGPYAAYNSHTRKSILKKAQEKMKTAGYYGGDIDGGMGGRTQTAITTWQQINTVPPTGLLDQLTLEKMMLLGLAEQSAPVATKSSSSSRRSSSSSSSRAKENDNDSGSSHSKWMRYLPGRPF